MLSLEMVEAGRIELPSENDQLVASTGLGQVLVLPCGSPLSKAPPGQSVKGSRRHGYGRTNRASLMGCVALTAYQTSADRTWSLN